MPLRKNSSFYYLQKCENEDEKLFKEEESSEILKIIVLIEKSYLKIMTQDGWNKKLFPWRNRAK